MRVLIREETNASWKQLQVLQISLRAALDAHVDEFGTIQQTAWFRLPIAFAISSISTIFYLAGQSRIVRAVSLA